MRQAVSWNALDLARGTRIGSTVVPARFVSRWVPDSDEEREHTVEMEMAVYDGVVTCDAITVRRHPRRPSLTGNEVRRVPIAEYMEQATVGATTRHRGTSNGTARIAPATPDEVAEVRRDARKALRRRVTPALLRDVARIYKTDPARPVAEVQEQLNCSRSTAERYVRAARKEGLI